MKSGIRLVLLVSALALSATASDKSAPVPAAAPGVASQTAQPAVAVSTILPTPLTLLAPIYPAEPAPALLLKPRTSDMAHSFFDRKNCTAFGFLAAGLTGDALSTQKGLGLPGFREMNPIARPFVKSRAGAAVYSAISFALMGGGMYLAHKTNHHKLERVLPLVIAGWEGFLAARNYHLISAATPNR
ncbi:MAG TPA: hypothetical protein VFP59_12615 [Candidatus Angelobacter sp.]|nr:hypothetical protein [Candidatus Angelobacter sp.]